MPPWRDVPERCGSWRTVHGLFRRRQRAGIWQQILTRWQAMAGARGPDRLAGQGGLHHLPDPSAHRRRLPARRAPGRATWWSAIRVPRPVPGRPRTRPETRPRRQDLPAF
ncbi:transposase [Nonomuraea phyllanthi]|uniref:Transposase n=1 Tax=Nonomuraea phyllanthi TaxID=2219224 RepID=A0A5C4W589_9ACTN|nr:transposase [Nonomuraea phyllanthi]